MWWSIVSSSRTFKQAYRCCGQSALNRETAELRNASAPARVLFQLIFVQGNAVQQITLILGSCIVIDAEPFADCTELVKHFNSSRGHSFDLDIHKNSFSPKREGKNRPVATNFQFLKILATLGQLLVGACLPQTLLGTSTANWNFCYSTIPSI